MQKSTTAYPRVLCPSYGCKYFVVFLSVSCLLVSSSPLRAETRIDVEQALALYEASISKLESYDVYLIVDDKRVLSRVFEHDLDPLQPRDRSERQLPPPPLQYKAIDREFQTSSRQRLSGDKFRLDSLKTMDEEYPEGSEVTAWNGEELRAYSAARLTALLAKHATIPHLMGENGPPYAVLFKMCFGNYSYAQMVRDRDSQAESDGGLIKIVAPPTGGAHLGIYGVKIWLAKDQGYMPTRIEWYVKKGKQEVKSNEIVNQLEEVAPGLWLPMKSKLRFFIEDPRTEVFGEVYSTMDVGVDLKRSSFNLPIDDAKFEIEFAEGTVVADRIRSIQYKLLKHLTRYGN